MLTWSDIRGHRRNLEVLERGIASGRLHHALLFSGPKGVGKRSVALSLAAAMNCLEREPGQFAPPCGRCNSCYKMAAGLHPDLVVVAPEKTTIKIGQIRQLVRTLRLAPFEGRFRIIVLEDAHTMSIEAANALLKTLEEPSARTRLILVTDQAHRLLDTIISRCQRVVFGALSRGDVLSLLERRVAGDEALASWRGDRATIELAAGYGEGSVGRALEVLERGLLGTRRELLGALEGVDGRRPQHWLETAQALGGSWGQREQFTHRLEMLIVLYRDALRLTLGGDSDDLVNGDMHRPLSEMAEARGRDALLRGLERLLEAVGQLERNINPQLVAEQLLLALAPPRRPSR